LMMSLINIPDTLANDSEDKGVNQANQQQKRTTKIEVLDCACKTKRATYQSALTITYPDAVRGVYVTGHSAGGQRLSELIDLVNSTDLNAMVIDIKDDDGNLTYKVDPDSPYADYSNDYIDDLPGLLKKLEKEEIYPIARVVVFKDTKFAEEHP